MFITLAIWFFFSTVVFMFAADLNNASFLGYQLGYYMTAQGSMLAFIILIFWSNSRLEKIDYTLSLHDALPICELQSRSEERRVGKECTHRPLAPIPVRFAPLLVPLFTFPACSAAAPADKHAAPPAPQDPPGEQGRAPRMLISHYLSRHNSRNKRALLHRNLCS